MDEVFERVKARRMHLEDRRKKLLSALALIDQELGEIDGFFAVATKYGVPPPAPQPEGSPRNAMANAFAMGSWPLSSLIGDAGKEGGLLSPEGFSGTNALAAYSRGAAVQHGSKRRLIIEGARETIRRYGALSARRMLQFLDAEGIGKLIPGRDERQRVGYLSALLSKEPMFKSDRDLGGYVVVEGVPPTDGQEGSDN